MLLATTKVEDFDRFILFKISITTDLPQIRS